MLVDMELRLVQVSMLILGLLSFGSSLPLTVCREQTKNGLACLEVGEGKPVNSNYEIQYSLKDLDAQDLDFEYVYHYAKRQPTVRDYLESVITKEEKHYV
ncbi:hypothetical protein K7432_007249 [Basidiobolus ranarum]|uniref:Uncharacterized protein n=1 Tax=Basidiobolus ranarum TaxID=34480 RepID=A0ABR2W0U6_9FUNG